MWKKIRKKWRVWRGWKRTLIVVLFLIAVRVLLFESFSMGSNLNSYPNHEKYQKYILTKINGSEYNLGIFRPKWCGKRYYFLFQWDYRNLIRQIREDLFYELDTLLENNDAVINYKVDEEKMVVDIYYDNDANRDDYLSDNMWKIRSLCNLWYRVVYSETPGDYQAEINRWNADGYPIS